MKAKMEQTEEGRMILTERPIVSREIIDLNYLRSLPSDTFGRAYIDYMDNHG